MTIKYTYVACVPIRKANKEILRVLKKHLHIQVPSYIKTDVQLAVLLAVDLFCYSVFCIALKKNKSQDNHKELSISIFSVLLKTWRYASPYFYFYARLHSPDSEGQNRSLQPLTPNSFQNWTSRNPDLLMSNGIIFLGVTRINPMFNLKE